MSVALNAQLGPKERLGKRPGYSAGNHIPLRNTDVTLSRHPARAHRRPAAPSPCRPFPPDSTCSNQWAALASQTLPVWVRKAKPTGNAGMLSPT